ncbi:MAG: tRNA (N6-threonylcarbamoyladenosine(37)-N6)-methyltransferase TrmO [Deltaproteobacteria bacterium]|nr:tRNA (N6-threonylcarbamoyladenosine(37)-N6)-methyltransferase TrmO [Deltaproteobacteria bacterium]
MAEQITVRPIGFVRSPFGEKAEAPRQAVVAEGVEGRIEVLPEHEHALDDLAGFERIWVVSWFDRAVREGPRPSKVLPPRSEEKRGVFATRSPHRPNPIGLSAVRLARVEGLVVHVLDLDLVDGTPVLDIKPYLPYADAFPDAKAGWLEAKATDPRPAWEVRFTDDAEAQLAWIRERPEIPLDLRARITETLSLGPQPHPYRRIKKDPHRADAFVLAVKDWRATFTVRSNVLEVARIGSGWRPKDLANGIGEELAVHRAFVARFG